MAQHDYNLADALPGVFRTDANNLFAAIKSDNSDGTTAPSDPVAGMGWAKPASGTEFDLHRYDGTQWTLLARIDPSTGKLYSADGVRRTWGGIAGGTADALTISTALPISAYEDGQRFVFVTSAANTGACTLNVDGIGAAAIKLEGQDPGAGDLPSGALVEAVRYNGAFHVMGGPRRRASTSQAGFVVASTEAQFLAGTPGVVPDAAIVKKHARERLQANRTYYVRTDGSDSNTGLANSSGGAWATLQKAWNYIFGEIDFAGYTIRVKLQNGAYTAGLAASGGLYGAAGPSSLTIEGDPTTPGNVTLTITGGNCFTAANGAALTVRGIKVSTVTSGDCIVAQEGGHILYDGCEFGACAGAHLNADGGQIEAAEATPYTISASMRQHWNAEAKGIITADNIGTITLTGVSIGTAFARADGGNISATGNSFSGSAGGLGRKYNASKLGVINTGTADPNHLPGAVAGTTSTGGVYA